MAKRPLPDPETLRKLLRYDAETGLLYWRERTPDMFASKGRSRVSSARVWNGLFAGKEAFPVGRLGYRNGYIFDRPVLAHRVVWAMHYNRWPIGQIDHINLDRADNRIANLREATASENSLNRPISKNNTSGYKGVAWDVTYGRYVARICARGQRHFLGRFDCPEEAHRAYTNAAKKLAGPFARTK